MIHEPCPCVEDPEFFNDDGICRTCPWRLVSAVLAGRGVPMSRKDYLETVVAALSGERHEAIIRAVARNYCVSVDIAKVALRRARRTYKQRKIREKAS